MRAEISRMPVLDVLKAIACLLIVAHHLAFYGPMSDAAYPLAPALIDGLYDYGRMAVQIFFVTAGFLMAGKLAPDGQPQAIAALAAIRQRYLRLAIPYGAALLLAIACAALARIWLDHDSIPAAPTLPQLVAHALLLQDLLDEDALSAGVWYVAIDFQLFALAVLLFRFAQLVECRATNLRATAPLLIAGLTVASLFVFNRDDAWDETALYFFGAYGLGALGYWASKRRHGLALLALLATVVVAALLLDFRGRIAVAGATALALGLIRQYGVLDHWRAPRPFAYLGRISYSIFLVHFPLCLLVSAAFAGLFPGQPLINAFGMILAVGVSILGGGVFFRWVESRPITEWTRWWPAGFVASGLLAALAGDFGA
jgi:peptidoglycan/LPS O-acetylase OafA/YrhL